MHIIYIVNYKSAGERWLSRTLRESAGLALKPSECIWIVPGTITA